MTASGKQGRRTEANANCELEKAREAEQSRLARVMASMGVRMCGPSRGPGGGGGGDEELEEEEETTTTPKGCEGKPINLEDKNVRWPEQSSKICIQSRTGSPAVALLLLLAAAAAAPEIEALKVTIAVPELVKLNEPFWLNCSHQQQQREIYAIKWYKDGEEFYRFLPRALPKVSIYETNGIQLDGRSQEGNVLVGKADVNSEGLYRCEIIAEAPLFETVAKSSHLRVYALPVRGPRIEILDQQGRPRSPKQADISYAVGDRIELRCNSAPSKPAARLRWYLNEHELQVPQAPGALTRIKRKSPNVRVGHVELRQHYKNIYSSHSNLSLVLQQDDLINNKISFKCLASMRQPVGFRSKQLIVLTPPASPGPIRRRRRQLASANEQIGARPEEEEELGGAHQRPHHHRHSISRLSSGNNSNNDHIALANHKQQQLLYIYEDADSTLGPNIIDSAQSLEGYLQSAAYGNLSGAGPHEANDFNRATDNLELVQLVRERQARHRWTVLREMATGGPTISSSGSTSHNLKRLHGSNFLFKSPLYLDEHDSLRPVISWPPLDSGSLFLMDGGAGSPLVALPTRRNQLESAEARLVLPPGKVTPMGLSSTILDHHQNSVEGNLPEHLVERLIASLNCTCAEASSETKMSWLVNETPLEQRNTRFHSPRVSPDHKQTWHTIGLQLSPPNTLDSRFAPDPSGGAPQSLQSILRHYFHKSPTSSLPIASKQTSDRQLAENNQIKFACQAIHPMLLYSSSEIITFDFNPPSPHEGGPSAPVQANNNNNNNVIQATSASQSSSATCSLVVFSRSQTIFALFTLSTLLISLLENFHGRPIITRE